MHLADFIAIIFNSCFAFNAKRSKEMNYPQTDSRTPPIPSYKDISNVARRVILENLLEIQHPGDMEVDAYNGIIQYDIPKITENMSPQRFWAENPERKKVRKTELNALKHQQQQQRIAFVQASSSALDDCTFMGEKSAVGDTTNTAAATAASVAMAGKLGPGIMVPQIVRTGPGTIRDEPFQVVLGNVRVGVPIDVDTTQCGWEINMNECQQRMLMYMSPIHADIAIEEMHDTKTKTPRYQKKRTIQQLPQAIIGYIPVMLGSILCAKEEIRECKQNYTTGLFVINGQLKYIAKRARMAWNRIEFRAGNGKDSIFFSELRTKNPLKEFNQPSSIVQVLLSSCPVPPKNSHQVLAKNATSATGAEESSIVTFVKPTPKSSNNKALPPIATSSVPTRAVGSMYPDLSDLHVKMRLPYAKISTSLVIVLCALGYDTKEKVVEILKEVCETELTSAGELPQYIMSLVNGMKFMSILEGREELGILLVANRMTSMQNPRHFGMRLRSQAMQNDVANAMATHRENVFKRLKTFAGVRAATAAAAAAAAATAAEVTIPIPPIPVMDEKMIVDDDASQEPEAMVPPPLKPSLKRKRDQYESLLLPQKRIIGNDTEKENFSDARRRLEEACLPIHWIYDRVLMKVDTMLSNDLLTHIPETRNRVATLLYMMVRTAQQFNPDRDMKHIDGRDNYINQRIESGSSLIFSQYVAGLKEYVKALIVKSRSHIEANREFDLASIVNSITTITKIFRTMFATGMVSNGKRAAPKKGVVQPVSRITLISYYSALTKIHKPINHTRKHSEPRQLHNSQVEFICVAETPEGKPCGLVINLAMTTILSTTTPEWPIACYILRYMALIQNEEVQQCVKGGEVFVNGSLLGHCKDIMRLAHHLRFLRRNLLISPFVGLELMPFCALHIATDSSRMMKPLLIVDEGELVLEKVGYSVVLEKLQELKQQSCQELQVQNPLPNILNGSRTGVNNIDNLREGSHLLQFHQWLLKMHIIEYIDCAEMSDPRLCCIALPKIKVEKWHTHAAIHPCTIYGIAAGALPFPHHNQSPRNTYAACMSKHAIGTSSLLTPNLMESVQHYLWYPQKPLVSSVVDGIYGMDLYGGGDNCVILVGASTGNDQEDSVQYNQAAIDRGLLRSQFVRRYRAVESKEGPNIHQEQFEKPLPHQCSNIGLDASRAFQQDSFTSSSSTTATPNNNQFGRVISSNPESSHGGLMSPPLASSSSTKNKGIISTPPMMTMRKPTTPSPSTSAPYNGGVNQLPPGFNALDWNGFPKLFSRVVEGDKLIGKTIENPQNANVESRQTRDDSVTIRQHEQGIVSRGLLTSDIRNMNQFVANVSEMRVPKVADKGTLRNAQKGTIGKIVKAVDMPFSAQTGMQPDIIINPHCLPSRMTISMVLEFVMGKAACMDGVIRDGTAFEDHDKDAEIHNVLKEHGFEPQGEETFIDGVSGKMMQGTVFMGVAHYQRLKHMAQDKTHARYSGPVNRMTRQPTEGRARNGGFRFGEMETEVLIGHGASRLLQDRMCDNSDMCQVWICGVCGTFATHSELLDAAFCNVCGTSETLEKVKTSHAYVLFTQELACCGINMVHSLGNDDRTSFTL